MKYSTKTYLDESTKSVMVYKITRKGFGKRFIEAFDTRMGEGSGHFDYYRITKKICDGVFIDIIEGRPIDASEDEELKYTVWFNASDLFECLKEAGQLEHYDFHNWLSTINPEERVGDWVFFGDILYFFMKFSNSLLSAWVLKSFVDGIATKRKPQENVQTYIYYDCHADSYKIGRTKGIDQRNQAITNANPDMRLVLLIADNVEKELHETYQDRRIYKNREFFKLNSHDIDDIAEKYSDKLVDISTLELTMTPKDNEEFNNTEDE